MSSVVVRQMRPDDVEKVIEWTTAEKWSLTAFDLRVFRECHPQDFFIAELDGRPVGSVSGVRNDDNTGVLGVFIVDKHLRGKGVGGALLRKVLGHLGIEEGRNCGLSGREDVAPVYVRKGFVNCVWNVVMYGWKVDSSKVAAFDLEGVKVKRVTKDNLDLLLGYDRTIQTFCDRRKYFELYLENDENVACVAVKEMSGSDTVLGFAMAKPAAADWGSHIGPLYANSLDVAKVLFRFLYENQPNVKEGIYVETIQPNQDNVQQLMAAVGIGEPKYILKKQFSKEVIPAPFDKIYTLPNTDIHFY